MIYSIKTLQKIQRICFSSHERCISGLNLWNKELTSEIKHKIESHWKERLQNENFDEYDSSRGKYYVLSMFPYPSGFLHMGHVRVYTISDAIARFQRMNGKNVLHPIGWDAFGLPAENAAIERGIAPNDWTQQNISHMKHQLKRLGCSFEWEREMSTCDPSYYRWTQDLFLKLYKSGLAYQKEATVNWDPVDQTVLADEQVDENGCSWRSGAKVEKKLLNQWFIRTTKFAKDLLDGLDDSVLQDWRDIIKLQRHWIGECDGVSFDFKLKSKNYFLTLWTSKPEFIKSAKFVALSHGHVLATGDKNEGTIKLKDSLIHPLTEKEIPIFITNEIEYLPSTDSFIGIPLVCEQSENFAKNYNIDFERESVPVLSETDVQNLQRQVCEEARSINRGGHWTSAKLRDWLISRQRFWGTPIPIIHCRDCGAQPVPSKDLPVKLPDLTKLSRKGSSLLSDNEGWVNVSCPKCNRPAQRETDTMDTFVDSSWYYLRYLDPYNSDEMFDKLKAAKCMPVDLYIGGKEHAVLHLYYARFISHFLHSLGLLPEREPFKRLLVQGMVMGRTFRIKGTGKYVPESKVKITDKKKNQGIVEETGEAVTLAWEKMSKSKHNGVDPDEMFQEYGVDTTRLLILADVAPTSQRNWNSSTFPGILNWQKRLWLTIKDFIKHRQDPPPTLPEDQFKTLDCTMYDSRNYYLKGVTFNYCGSQQHSVAISKQQGLTNSIRKAPPSIFAHSPQFEQALATQIILLAPMAPHFASELWSGFLSAPNRLNDSGEIQWDKTVLEQKWPEIDSNYCLDLVCEVNGLEVCRVKIPRKEMDKLSQEQAVEAALLENRIQEELSQRIVKKYVYVVKEGYGGTLNIKTNFVPMVKKKKAKRSSVSE